MGYRGRGYRLQVTGYGAKSPILTILDKSTINQQFLWIRPKWPKTDQKNTTLQFNHSKDINIKYRFFDCKNASDKVKPM